MTITGLVSNFRNGLQGLLPSVERVGLRWRRPDAYDEWDHLVAAVYEALVVEQIRSGLAEADLERFKLPRYDTLLPTYAGFQVIELVPPDTEQQVRVFHALGTSESPFDVVEWRAVRVDGTPLSEELRVVAVKGARFQIRALPDLDATSWTRSRR